MAVTVINVGLAFLKVDTKKENIVIYIAIFLIVAHQPEITKIFMKLLNLGSGHTWGDISYKHKPDLNPQCGLLHCALKTVPMKH